MRWQRRWFVLYDDGEFTYAVDDHPETIPQACIDMTKVLEVTSAEDVTGHLNSLAVTAPDRVTFVKGTCPEEAKWWLNILSAFPKTKGRHKRNATFPGGQATTILQNQPMQSGRSRHNSYHKDTLPSAVTNLEAMSSSWSASPTSSPANENNINANNEMNNNNKVYNDQPVSSKSPPTRDKIQPEVKAQARIRNRNRGQDAVDTATLLIEDALREEKLKDIANTITNINHHSNNRWSTQSTDEKPTRDENSFPCEYNSSKIQLRPKSLQLTSSTAPAIVSAIVKKVPASGKADVMSRLNSSQKLQQQSNERGDPDGGCNMDDVSVNYLSKTSELRVKLPSEELLNSKKGWLMKQEPRTGDWTKHWFSLRGAALFYYRDPMAEERGVLDGVLDVNGLTGVCEIPVARNYGFQLTTWDNRRIVLSTISANIRNNWLNVLRSAAGLVSSKQQCKGDNDENGVNEVIIKDNTSDDLKSEIEKDFIKAKRQDSTDTAGTEASSPCSSKTITPVTPMTPKSMLFSSDEEYRTASEGGRRDSVDWGSPMSPSPPIPLLLARAKDRIRSRSSSNSRLHKRSRSSPPSSRRSTIDSVGSDDLPVIEPVQEELNIDRELHLRLVEAEKELNFLKEEAQTRDTRTSELITTLERTEMNLGSQIREAEEARDSLAKQLNESRKKAEEIIARLSSELEDTHCRCKELEDRLSRGIEENEILYKKIRDMEGGTVSSLTNLSKKMKRVDSLSDLTSLSDIDPYSLERDMLADEYNELKSRFEKAVNEIRAMKKELKESQNEYDNLEITHATLRQDLERKELHDRSQLQLMGERIQDLTLKYSNSDRQVRQLKQKLSKSEKRRSLSLKGRDSMTVQKELEDKVNELECKIDALETIPTTSDPTNVTTSKTPTLAEDRALKRASARLRRKSLDGNTSEAVQIMLRLNTLEKRIEKTTSTPAVAKTEATNHVNNNSSPKMSEHLIERLRSLENVVITSKERIDQSLQQLQCLKTSKTRRSMSPITDRKDSYRFIERCLTEVAKILKDSCENCIIDDCPTSGNTKPSPETNSITLALAQMEAQLRCKLNDLLNQRRVLREKKELTGRKNLELLAERVAYESVCFAKLRDAINRAEDPTQFGEKQTRAEATETSQLMSLLKTKLSGKCAIKSNGTIDVLANVLARRLLLTANRTGHFKLPEMSPISSLIMDDLIRQQNELNLIAKRYKNNAMENLACGLAAETLSYISTHDGVQGAVQEAWRQAQEAVNTELVQSEIAHIMMRNSSRLEHTLRPSFGFTLTTQERVSFENFADAVQDALRIEMDLVVSQLTRCYRESLEEMKRGQWRLHLEQERKLCEGRQLLAEFADIVAHKALVDARISVLKGEYISKDVNLSKDSTFSLTTLQKYENLFAELATDLQISDPENILVEADFNFMYKNFTTEFATDKNEIKEVSDVLHKLEQTVVMLQTTLIPNTCISLTHQDAESLRDICNKCKDLQDRVEPLIPSALNLQTSCDDCEKLKTTMADLNEQHLVDLDDLRKMHAKDCDQLRQQLDDQLMITRALEEEKHQVLKQLSVERDRLSHREEELHEITKKLEKQEIECHLKDEENFELVETLEEERQRITAVTEESKNLLEQYKVQTDAYNALLQERDYIMDQLEKERERVRKLENRLELLQEEQSQQIESLHAVYREQQMSMGNGTHENDEEANFKLRYQTEIEQLRTLCEKGLVAMESSHRRIISDLEEKHRQEIQRLLCEKEQALAEETQATLAALDAMRKAHQNEVQREIARFKAEFVRQYQKGGQSSDSHKGKEEELDEVREEILSLSEKYSVKCVEAASLEEKCRLATHQLKHFQQHIQQLETRNKHLRAHLASKESDYSYCHDPSSKESTPSPKQEHVDDAQSSTELEETSKENSFSQHCKKEIHPRLSYKEGIRLASLFNQQQDEEVTTTVYAPKITTMRLRLDKTRCPTSNNQTITNNNIEDSEVLKMCSPPPLDGKDVEHNIRRFELEI
ncbi:Protein outspread [Pseudolycoriella hygida]|uniref:Protein outspread n=1 Tax=Pseudolycoriella hygida TaxID=35572 RepID=A0A9Q0N9C3_9DIPT|nr:Protein outspread [Pseudolycoriella hygida]